jgi:ubiquinone/menaquinone biosynthesis C-methylase UbiE
VGDGHSLPFPDGSFDVVLIQGVLHHDNDAEGIVREACRVGREIIVFEPNGNSPLLKILEKVSPYHRQHKEKSYFPRTIDRWLAGAGATVVMRRYSNFVPVLAPELMARVCKAPGARHRGDPGGSGAGLRDLCREGRG